ncbi:MAG: DEAD/DEAH box helicase [Bacteroidaceae bacterium]|nr:DEAD/DEAH box helicase [Bacteroidaceae bacterium]
MKFEDLDLNYDVLDALDDMNFVECTPIQEHTIPPLLEGRDLIGVAQTGTGKTAAYLLPVLSKLRDGGYPKDAINCVIMAPTRELAQQIDQAMEGFAYYLDDISSVAVYGGNDGIRYEQEKRGMQMGADVVIATPGRFISHLSLGNIDLSHVSFFILDEADRMLDMGFSEDIMQIVKYLPKERQTIMFSATMPQKIIDLAKTILTDPVEVKLAVSKPAEKIQQSAYICYEPQKLRLIEYIFKSPTSAPSEGEKLHGDSASESLPSRGDLEGSLNRVIIFVGKKSYVKDVTYTLKRRGFNAEAMHSDLSQPERDDVMWRFKTGKISVLVATDIVARGIDIDDIQLVINFDVPRDCEDYVHRIGRTARANRDGRAITLVSEKDQPLFRDIERFLEKEITKNPIPEELGEGPEYTGRASGGNERGGKRRRRGRGGHGRGRGDHGKDKHSSNSGKRTHGRADRPRSEKTKSEKPRNNNSTN